MIVFLPVIFFQSRILHCCYQFYQLSGILYCWCFALGGAEYISAHSRDLSRQPHDHRDVSASVLEHHQSELCEERDWETEWNRQGLASKLTPEVKNTGRGDKNNTCVY